MKLKRKVHTFFIIAALSVSTLFIETTAEADVFGRIKIEVKNIENNSPIENAKITIHDLSHVVPDILLKTDSNGSVTSPRLENRTWKIEIDVEKFSKATREVKVVSDTTSKLDFSLQPIITTIKISARKGLMLEGDTSGAVSRGQDFLKKSQLPHKTNNNSLGSFFLRQALLKILQIKSIHVASIRQPTFISRAFN